MNPDEFQVTLPSNASTDLFPGNTPANYRTKLARPIILDAPENWQVALMDIQYPQSFVQLTESQLLVIAVEFPDGKPPATRPLSNYAKQLLEEFEGHQQSPEKRDKFLKNMGFDRPPVFIPISLPQSEFRSIEALASYITQQVDEFFAVPPMLDLKIKFDEFTQRTSIVYRTAKNVALFSSLPEVFDALGLDRRFDTADGERALFYTLANWPSTKPPPTTRIASIYVYSDIIKYQLIGDTEAPIMGVAPVQLEDGDGPVQSYWAFNPPYYHNLSKGNISEIEIQLNTDTGAKLPILAGRVVCRLHFRRKYAPLGLPI